MTTKLTFGKVIMVVFLFLLGMGIVPLTNVLGDLPTTLRIIVDPPPSPYDKPSSPFLSLSSLSILSDDKKMMISNVFSGISISDYRNLVRDITYMDMHKIKKWDIYINSPGGDAFQGLSIADQILKAKSNGVHVRIFGSGVIASAALPIFAQGHKRFATRSTLFMIHESALWKWPGRETASDIESQHRMMNMLQDMYMAHIVSNSTSTRKDWDAREKQTTWFTAEKAKEWGIVDTIE
jgi:ATP-dependent protease ClpP protease subunit